MNNTTVDSYLAEGCGRCDKFQTPDCKVHRWTAALAALRELLCETELVEEMKWGAPCYTLDGVNVVSMSALNDHCVLGFFKGAGLPNPDGLLERQGPNSRLGRIVRFASAGDVERRRDAVLRTVRDAIEFQRAGGVLELPPAAEPVPEELAQALVTDAILRDAWDALTPGRRRSHILHIGGAKQAATRARRVQKCAPRIIAGKGFNER